MVTVLVEGFKNYRTIEGWGYDGYKFVQPVVVRTETGVGVGLVILRKGSAAPLIRFWEHPTRKDLITCWRAMKILEYIQCIQESNLEDAYYAALRQQHDEFMDKTDRIACALLTLDFLVYARGMRLPEEIVDLIITLWDEGIRCDTTSIAEELRAGKLAWRDEFVGMGLQKPRENRIHQIFDWLWR